MVVKEEDITLMGEDIQGGYSQVQLVYAINDCLLIDLYVKDWKRGVEVLKIIEEKLKDVDLSDDVKYEKKYNEAVDNFIKHQEEKKKKSVGV